MDICVDLQVEVSSERITEGQKITLTCKTSSSCPSNKLNFIWYKNKQLLNLQHSNNKLNVGPEDTGRYSCALTDYNSFPSAEKDINVLYAPRNTTASVRYLETGDVNLTCSSDAHPEPKYNWFKTSDTGQILGRGQSLTVKTGNTGFFYCEATNTIGSQNSTVIRLKGIKSDVMFDRRGFIISLLSLLILLILMLISAAVWRM
ncbi:B-cell receptor CD22-like [Paramisgurnus dabryanus]|uniref:B-cell receptor CD22-like n=1 Tax=Paramisgurnus dabryanus TaxID=90735 RepID=UPI0031F3ADCD